MAMLARLAGVGRSTVAKCVEKLRPLAAQVDDAKVLYLEVGKAAREQEETRCPTTLLSVAAGEPVVDARRTIASEG